MANLHTGINNVVVLDNAVPAQRASHGGAIERAADLPESLKMQAMAVLDRLPDGDRICHGDLHPDNMLLTSNGPIAIDWITASRGVPAADVARTLLILQHGEIPPRTSRIASAMIRVARRIFAAAYWRDYRRLTGMSRAEVDAWRIPLLAARLNESLSPNERAGVCVDLSRLFRSSK